MTRPPPKRSPTPPWEEETVVEQRAELWRVRAELKAALDKPREQAPKAAPPRGRGGDSRAQRPSWEEPPLPPAVRPPPASAPQAPRLGGRPALEVYPPRPSRSDPGANPSSQPIPDRSESPSLLADALGVPSLPTAPAPQAAPGPPSEPRSPPSLPAKPLRGRPWVRPSEAGLDADDLHRLTETSAALARVIPGVLLGLTVLGTLWVFGRISANPSGASPHVALELLASPSGPQLPPDPVRVARLVIETDPPGLLIVHAQEVLGKTPCDLALGYDLPDQATVRLSSPRFDPWVATVGRDELGEYRVVARLAVRRPIP